MSQEVFHNPELATARATEWANYLVYNANLMEGAEFTYTVELDAPNAIHLVTCTIGGSTVTNKLLDHELVGKPVAVHEEVAKLVVSAFRLAQSQQAAMLMSKLEGPAVDAFLAVKAVAWNENPFVEKL